MRTVRNSCWLMGGWVTKCSSRVISICLLAAVAFSSSWTCSWLFPSVFKNNFLSVSNAYQFPCCVCLKHALNCHMSFRRELRRPTLGKILWNELPLLPIFRVLILVWNDLWSYWTIVSCYEMGVEKWKWYDMSILLILNVCVTKWVHFAIWLILDQS